ncbi:hypothetical protein SAMN05421847_0776 [Halpernia humi]|uniref:Uncharacterized protein n=1 Tax=Halpernia humi TaxID=493375 RepID=A0A1H5UFA4_9FLAO|nr:hypothetical protein SAMN05421847_0776 [Halpernia humi]
MKNLDTLKAKILTPKKETVLFLLQFSKSITVIKSKNKKYLVSKN